MSISKQKSSFSRLFCLLFSIHLLFELSILPVAHLQHLNVTRCSAIAQFCSAFRPLNGKIKIACHFCSQRHVEACATGNFWIAAVCCCVPCFRSELPVLEFCI